MKGNKEFYLDLENTEIAFSSKSDKSLHKMNRLFQLMKNTSLVKLGSSLGMMALKLRIPFTKYLIKNTIFEQFVGGETLEKCKTEIDILSEHKTLTVLDYGAEAKNESEELDKVKDEVIRALDFGSKNESVTIATVKLTGLVQDGVLEELQAKGNLSATKEAQLQDLLKRLHAICNKARESQVGIYIDAEESWIQDSIDEITTTMMKEYNRDKAVVYNTFQMYRHDRLEYLKSSYEVAKAQGYILGAKIVRGAYMEKERKYASDHGLDSPIQKNKEATDKDYDSAISFCLDHLDTISFCCATHNMSSTKKCAERIHEDQLELDHEHIAFSQLYGMSDYITFNLAEAGYNVSKYVPYGPIDDVIPYLIRRAEENTSVSGEMTRELHYIQEEIQRRRKN